VLAARCAELAQVRHGTAIFDDFETPNPIK
jgi:hypothetical protein